MMYYFYEKKMCQFNPAPSLYCNSWWLSFNSWAPSKTTQLQLFIRFSPWTKKKFNVGHFISLTMEARSHDNFFNSPYVQQLCNHYIYHPSEYFLRYHGKKHNVRKKNNKLSIWIIAQYWATSFTLATKRNP